MPYFPITPTFPWLGPLGLVPLPTKWIIQFGEPIATDGYPPEAAEDPMLVFNLTDQVRETDPAHLVRTPPRSPRRLLSAGPPHPAWRRRGSRILPRKNPRASSSGAPESPPGNQS